MTHDSLKLMVRSYNASTCKLDDNLLKLGEFSGAVKMNRRVGFTLIELLVVIAIIALLLAILMPSLNKVKEIAASVVCLNNQKSLSMAYRMYAEDMDGKVASRPFGWEGGWVDETQNDLGIKVNVDDATLEHRINGVEAGVLFPYLETHKVYHCNGDKRWLNGTWIGDEPRQLIYVSYALPDSLLHGTRTINFTSIKQPATSYLFLEDGYDGNVASNEGWTLDVDKMSLGNPGSWFWHDPMGTYHTDGCTFSFVDGHAEKYKWKDDRSIIYFGDRGSMTREDAGKDNEDVAHMLSYYPRID